jgi:TonB family protein
MSHSSAAVRTQAEQQQTTPPVRDISILSPNSNQILGTGLDGPGGITALKKEIERYDLMLGLDLVAERINSLRQVSGVAIALQQGPIMVCVASIGTAPELGTAVRTEKGLSGECLRSAQTIYCQNTLADPRLNPELRRSLELGSILIIPIRRSRSHFKDVIGVLEIFSSSIGAFSEHTRAVLESVADLVGFTACTAQEERRAFISEPTIADPPHIGAPPRMPETSIQAHDMEVGAKSPGMQLKEQTHFRSLQSDMLACAIAVVAVMAVVVCIFVVRPSSGKNPIKRPEPEHVNASLPAHEAVPNSTVLPDLQKGAVTAHATRSPGGAIASTDAAEALVAPKKASLVSEPSEEGVEPQADNPVEQPYPQLPIVVSATNVTLATPVVKAANTSGGRLLKQVKPDYPRIARNAAVAGSVELEATVNEHGDVIDVRTVRGSPFLRHSAEEAVRKWQYEPLLVDGTPQTRTVHVVIRFDR